MTGLLGVKFRHKLSSVPPGLRGKQIEYLLATTQEISLTSAMKSIFLLSALSFLPKKFVTLV